MLPVSNSDRSVHLLPPDLCWSLLIASTAGLSHQVKTTDPTGMFPENFASEICVHSSRYTYQKSSRWTPVRRTPSRRRRLWRHTCCSSEACTCAPQQMQLLALQRWREKWLPSWRISSPAFSCDALTPAGGEAALYIKMVKLGCPECGIQGRTSLVDGLVLNCFLLCTCRREESFQVP